MEIPCCKYRHHKKDDDELYEKVYQLQILFIHNDEQRNYLVIQITGTTITNRNKLIPETQRQIFKEFIESIKLR